MELTAVDSNNVTDNKSLVTANSSDEDYDYHYYYVTEEQQFLCSMYDFAIETVLIGLLCVFGFVGNGFSTVCLLRDGSKSATPFLLVSLQVADTLFLIAAVWLRVIPSVNENFPEETASIGYLKQYVAYGFPCAMIAGTGRLLPPA